MHVRTKLPMAFEGKLYFAMAAMQLPVLSKCQLVWVEGSRTGHKATDTELTYAPASQAYGHRHKPQFIVGPAALQHTADEGRMLPWAHRHRRLSNVSWPVWVRTLTPTELVRRASQKTKCSVTGRSGHSGLPNHPWGSNPRLEDWRWVLCHCTIPLYRGGGRFSLVPVPIVTDITLGTCGSRPSEARG